MQTNTHTHMHRKLSVHLIHTIYSNFHSNNDCNDTIRILLTRFFMFSWPLIVVNYRLINIISTKKKCSYAMRFDTMNIMMIKIYCFHLFLSLSLSSQFLITKYWIFNLIERHALICIIISPERNEDGINSWEIQIEPQDRYLQDFDRSKDSKHSQH